MIYYVYRSLSKQKTGKGKISFATFQHFNIFASGSGPFFNYYMVPFLIIIYKIRVPGPKRSIQSPAKHRPVLSFTQIISYWL